MENGQIITKLQQKQLKAISSYRCSFNYLLASPTQ